MCSNAIGLLARVMERLEVLARITSSYQQRQRPLHRDRGLVQRDSLLKFIQLKMSGITYDS